MKVLQQQLALHPDTGLLADFLVYDHSEKSYKPSKGKVLERDSDGDFSYNACRQALSCSHDIRRVYCLLLWVLLLGAVNIVCVLRQYLLKQYNPMCAAVLSCVVLINMSECISVGQDDKHGGRQIKEGFLT